MLLKLSRFSILPRHQYTNIQNHPKPTETIHFILFLVFAFFLVCFALGGVCFLGFRGFPETKVTFRLGFGSSSSRSPWKRIRSSVGLHGGELWRFEVKSLLRDFFVTTTMTLFPLYKLCKV